jgi:hypothetical protein
MKLITLEQAKEYTLTEDNHILQKYGADFKVFEKSGSVEGVFTSWKSQLFNKQGEELVILIDEEGYWQPYVEYLFILHNVPKGAKYKFGYIDGTHHHLATFTGVGLASASKNPGYLMWIEYELIEN